ncbi:MAG: DUF4350 domain-containing protein [Verrucomicrobia bacterium]|nr:DUF4350 domain-containing protein [Verrucomicrobiota bacterium]
MRRINVVAWVILIGGVGALCFFGYQIFRARLETGDSIPQYSTYRADPKGLKALYESLEATDLIHVDRRLQWSKVLPSGENQVLVVAGVLADQQLVANELLQLFDHWLATGGRLIVALRPERMRPIRNQPEAEEHQKTEDEPSSIGWRNLIRRWGAEIVPPGQVHSATAKSPVFGTIERWLGGQAFDHLSSDWKVVAVQSGKSVIIERALGPGSLVLLTDSYPLSNEALAADRNTNFLLWLIDDRRGVLFEETHLGLNEQPGLMTLARRYGLQGTLVSLVAVLVLFIWTCQYTLLPRTKIDQNSLTVSGCSSDQAFINVLQRTTPQRNLLAVCITAWMKTARPTQAQMADLKKFRTDAGRDKTVVEGYNELTRLLHRLPRSNN